MDPDKQRKSKEHHQMGLVRILAFVKEWEKPKGNPRTKDIIPSWSNLTPLNHKTLTDVSLSPWHDAPRVSYRSATGILDRKSLCCCGITL